MTNQISNLNNPDSDAPTTVINNANFFKQLTPKTTLLLGGAAGMLALCTIGFLVLITMLLTGTLRMDGAPTNIAGSVPKDLPSAPLAANDQPQPEAPTGPVPPVTKQDHVRGTGPITLVEYSDFECPFCKRLHPTMLQIMNDYKGKVRWVYRHFPLGFHANAQKEAEATECANELGGNNAFWAYVDKIFERTQGNGTGFALDALTPLAKELGLNEGAFKKCLDSGKYAKHVQDEMTAGGAAGVTGTPGTFIIGKDGKAELISGALPYQQIKTLLDAALK
jgi:protein-disulfide isomerase